VVPACWATWPLSPVALLTCLIGLLLMGYRLPPPQGRGAPARRAPLWSRGAYLPEGHGIYLAFFVSVGVLAALTVLRILGC
jgi:hypothetical protein